ncbi:cation diffusion facilitator family transporter [Thermoactinomyces sp. CICC 23799]|uniref:cation diffusion facilitator family transporter n=1 Tax=Thermoactinomyces sp. CICC 23799 TaxID=2767429 RepID=UPI0018DB5290|nr:cation diffusion facilitator family transporter [Thermoactinomyces sp. CICC 23799]MBH8601414.1 cation transporter [Thermoactinomyces sp. CICC 23799]
MKLKSKLQTPMTAAWIGLVSNIALTILKLMVGFLFQSPSLIADGFHNLADIAASGATLGSMRISKMPADREHPYGHGKAEVIASGMVAIVLLLISLFMIYESVAALFGPFVEAHVLSLLAAVISLIWKQILYVYTIKIGKRVNSKGLIATAYDHLSDVYASLAAVVGIGLALWGQHQSVPFAEYGDPLASIVVSLLILRVAIHMGKEAVDILMERNIPEEELKIYRELILKVDGVKRIDQLRGREHGHYRLIDVRVGVPADLTVKEGHDIASRVKETLMNEFQEIQEVFVHVNPWQPPEP